MEIRPAEVEDLVQITALELSVYGKHAYSYIVLQQLLDLAGSTILVAEDDIILGFIIAAKGNNHGESWILNLLVDPQYRKTGVGYELTKKVIERLKKLKRRTIFLTVAPSNNAAYGLYSKLGFCEERFEKNYFGLGEDRLVMMKSLR